MTVPTLDPYKKMLVFVPMHNSHGKKDVTHAFLPEARRFIDCVGPAESRLCHIDNRRGMKARREAVLAAIEEADEDREYYDGVAFFCHGWSRGIQLGFMNGQVQELAEAIQSICEHSMTNVPLYCCSTGDDRDKKTSLSSPGTGDNSFADLLRDALCSQGANYCRVVAHTTVAHTTKNPYVLFFDGMGTPDGGVGGYAPVAPKTANWPRWRRALQKTDLRFRFPFMGVDEIHQELSGG